MHLFFEEFVYLYPGNDIKKRMGINTDYTKSFKFLGIIL